MHLNWLRKSSAATPGTFSLPLYLIRFLHLFPLILFLLPLCVEGEVRNGLFLASPQGKPEKSVKIMELFHFSKFLSRQI